MQKRDVREKGRKRIESFVYLRFYFPGSPFYRIIFGLSDL